MANQSSAKTNRLYEQLVERFARWAETCSDISAVIISRAHDPYLNWCLSVLSTHIKYVGCLNEISLC